MDKFVSKKFRLPDTSSFVLPRRLGAGTKNDDEKEKVVSERQVEAAQPPQDEEDEVSDFDFDAYWTEKAPVRERVRQETKKKREAPKTVLEHFSSAAKKEESEGKETKKRKEEEEDGADEEEGNNFSAKEFKEDEERDV